MSANDKQIAGTHYRSASSIQHWDYCDENDVPYLESACTKYVLRWREKNGLQDLEKARHYLEKRIENITRGVGAIRGGRMNLTDFVHFVVGANLEHRDAELEIIGYVMHWSSPAELELALIALDELIESVENDEADASPAYVSQD